MGQRSMTVSAGDNLWNISKRTLGAGHRWPEIYAANRDKIRDPDLIRAGMVLQLPERRRALSEPHPMQRTHPRIAALSGTGASSHPTADLGRPQAMPGSSPVAGTTVNNMAIKFDLALVKPVVMPIPGGRARLSWAGQVYLWRDGQRPLATVGNRGLELTEKKQASTALGHLLESRKLTVGLDRRVTYEDLMGTLSYGDSNTLVSGGGVVTSTSPFPVWRTQIKTKLRQGRFGDWLFIAEDMSINFDIEMDPEQPPAQPPLAQRVPVPANARAPARVTSDIGAHASTLQQVGAWTAAHKQEILIGALVVATVALALLTFGGSAVVEAGAAAAARAAASRAVMATGARALAGA